MTVWGLTVRGCALALCRRGATLLKCPPPGTTAVVTHCPLGNRLPLSVCRLPPPAKRHRCAGEEGRMSNFFFLRLQRQPGATGGQDCAPCDSSFLVVIGYRFVQASQSHLRVFRDALGLWGDGVCVFCRGSSRRRACPCTS